MESTARQRGGAPSSTRGERSKPERLSGIQEEMGSFVQWNPFSQRETEDILAGPESVKRKDRAWLFKQIMKLKKKKSLLILEKKTSTISGRKLSLKGSCRSKMDS